MTCGNLCKQVSPIVSYVKFVEKPAGTGDGVAYVIVRDDDKKYIIISFRGTNTMYQLLLEGIAEKNDAYDLHEIKDACVQSIFFERYKVVRDEMIADVQSLKANYPDYTFVFTGHSLGAALSQHAALDVALAGYVDASKIVNYNYGSPRVGNYAWAQKYNEIIQTKFRVVHYNDIFITWPVSCGKDSHSNCVTEQDDPHYGEPGGTFFGWHTDGQVFYDADMVSYQECSAEDPSCADQWHSIFKRSIPHHLNYLGVPLGCGSAELPKLKNAMGLGDTSECVHLPHIGLEKFWEE